jgi:hypothetical protein
VANSSCKNSAVLPCLPNAPSAQLFRSAARRRLQAAVNRTSNVKTSTPTPEAAMDLLNDLKAGGYKIVFMKPTGNATVSAVPSIT